MERFILSTDVLRGATASSAAFGCQPPTWRIVYLTLQARVVFRTQEITIPCRGQETAARVYDALSLNTRGPAAVATLNFPQFIPDSVFSKLAISRHDTDDAIGKFCDAHAHLVPALLAAAGAAAGDKGGALYGRGGSSGAGGSSGIWASEGIAFSSSSSQDVSEATAPAPVLSEGKMAILLLGLEVARERILTRKAAVGTGFLGVERKVCLSSAAAEAEAVHHLKPRWHRHARSRDGTGMLAHVMAPKCSLT